MRARWIAIATVVLLGAAAWAGRRGALALRDHHAAYSEARPVSELHTETYLALRSDGTVEDAVAAAAGVTGRHLRFGLQHWTQLSFDNGVREGNCTEYAHLFAALFNHAATQAKLGAYAYVVNSADARLLGRRLRGRGLRDHDWVLVVERTTGRRRYLDPSLGDAGLGWDIESSVIGEVVVPH